MSLTTSMDERGYFQFAGIERTCDAPAKTLRLGLDRNGELGLRKRTNKPSSAKRMEAADAACGAKENPSAVDRGRTDLR